METAWEGIYKKGEFLKREPHPEIEEVAKLLSKERVRRVLDLGCGTGRHTVYLARKGFDVYGLDSSYTGLAYTIRVLGEEGLTAHLTIHDIQSLPYSDGYFDAVISIQVIHHNKLKKIVNTIKEIARVLQEGGLIWITMPVSKNEPSKRQKEIEPGTFVPLDGREKGLPHHYFKLEEIPTLFVGFSIIELHVDVTNHFSLIARKNAK
jgi:ubiquinone/menaquinone biosynthesis C-methylase UbiE